jgi:glycosyltransferase involved in cell wall biosynthesis
VTTERAEPPEPRISAVLPVYNGGPYLRDCLDSLVKQDLPATDLEIIAIDDGSTDGSGDVLDEYAAAHPNILVLHQENSGWPGQPRNRGIERARGRYLFFVDGDDVVVSSAFRRLCDFADEHDSDVVNPKMVPLEQPRFKRPYLLKETVVDGQLAEAFKMISPQKLVRRSMVMDKNIRFPEGKVRLEDGIFMSEAYLAARRVSFLGDRDYYLKRTRDDMQNISNHGISPAHYVGSLTRMATNVRERCADTRVADDIISVIYRRKGLRRLRADKFLKYQRSRRADWARQLGQFAKTFVTPRMERQLPPLLRLQSVFARRADVPALYALAKLQEAGAGLRVVSSDGRLFLRLTNGNRRDVTKWVRAGERGVTVAQEPLKKKLRRNLRRYTSLGRRTVHRLRTRAARKSTG